MAATSLLVASASSNTVHGQEVSNLEEWSTDQTVNDNQENELDNNNKEKNRLSEHESICVPIGEGENCW
ncbi:hypothetical protein [Synechococcus sp. M16CYN]|uniref:hypothetical protein n=1 Tax=Synechococcus sp. M16CYN TaxID=3103139 RepID=UPI003342A94B